MVEPRTPWKFDVDELVQKNTHRVDETVIRTRVKDWQVVQPQYFGYFLNPADSSLLLDLGYSWLDKCLATKVQVYCHYNGVNKLFSRNFLKNSVSFPTVIILSQCNISILATV